MSYFSLQLYGPLLVLFQRSLSAGELLSADSEGCTPLLLFFLKYMKTFSSVEIHFSASEIKALPGQTVRANTCQHKRKERSRPMLCEQTNANRCTA